MGYALYLDKAQHNIYRVKTALFRLNIVLLEHYSSPYIGKYILFILLRFVPVHFLLLNVMPSPVRHLSIQLVTFWLYKSDLRFHYRRSDLIYLKTDHYGEIGPIARRMYPSAVLDHSMDQILPSGPRSTLFAQPENQNQLGLVSSN